MTIPPSFDVIGKKLPDVLHFISLKNTETNIAGFDEKFLIVTIQKRMVALGCSKIDNYLGLIAENQEENALLIKLMQVGYSEFFRNPFTFATIETILLPRMVKQRKKTSTGEIRFWSAACANGQEPYSLAMILEDYRETTKQLFPYRIFATDINMELLDQATSGYYSEKSLENLTLRRLKKWFVPANGGYKISEEIRRAVDFSVFDLLNENMISPPVSIFGNFDMVFCCNLLIYYNADYRRKILEKLSKSLIPDGYLITGPAERQLVKEFGFHETIFNTAIFQKKTSRVNF